MAFFLPSSSSCNIGCALSHSLTPSLPPLNTTTSTTTALPRTTKRRRRSRTLVCALNNALQYRKLGDSDLNISEITLGTVSFSQFPHAWF